MNPPSHDHSPHAEPAAAESRGDPSAPTCERGAPGAPLTEWTPQRLHRNARQFLKFGAVGGSGVLVNLAVFNLTMRVWALATGHEGGALPIEAEYLANALGFVVSVLTNYVLNRRWTFRSSGSQAARTAEVRRRQRHRVCGQRRRLPRLPRTARPGAQPEPAHRDRLRHADQLRLQQALELQVSAKRKARRGGGGRKPAAAAPGARRRRAAGRTPAPSVRPRDTAAQPTPQWLRTIVVSAAALGSLGLVLASGAGSCSAGSFGTASTTSPTSRSTSTTRSAWPTGPGRTATFPVEYPPLAVPLFTLPGRTGEMWAYADRFAAEMLVCVGGRRGRYGDRRRLTLARLGAPASPPSPCSRSASPSRGRSSPTATTPSSPCCSPSPSLSRARLVGGGGARPGSRFRAQAHARDPSAACPSPRRSGVA